MLANKIRRYNMDTMLRMATKDWKATAKLTQRLCEAPEVEHTDEYRQSVVDYCVSMSNIFMARNRRFGYDAFRALIMATAANSLEATVSEGNRRDIDEHLDLVQIIKETLLEMPSMDEVINNTVDPKGELRTSMGPYLKDVVDAEFEEVG